MIAQQTHSLRQLQTKVAFIADFGPITLPADGTYAFRFRLTDPGTAPATIYYLCLYYDNVLKDKVELSFADGPTCTTLGAAGLAGQRMSVRVQLRRLSPYAPWTSGAPVARPNLRGMLRSYWRAGSALPANRLQNEAFLPI